jgi:hypothetical protein
MTKLKKKGDVCAKALHSHDLRVIDKRMVSFYTLTV